MQPPSNVHEFLGLVERGRLLDAARIKAIEEKLSAQPAAINPPKLAELMIKQGLITRFQAEQLLQGRHKGFWVKHYKILDQVGIGGMARVFLAEHAIMRRKAALKVLPKAKCADPASLARFLREARAVAALNHPNVIRAYDIDQEGDFYFIVLEYAEGQSLAQFVEAHGPAPWPQACDFLYQAASGVEHLLAGGIVHRDLKPANIIVEKSGVVKLCDLGLAVFFEEKDIDPLTRKYDQNALGTADYLAPEQAVDSHTVDGRADIYSLGATFCFLLSGEPPYPGGTVAQKLYSHQTAAPISIRERAPDVPKELDAILQKMLAKRPEDRFQSVAELKAVLRRFVPVNSVAAQLSGTFAASNGPPPAHESGLEPERSVAVRKSAAESSGLSKRAGPPRDAARSSGLQKAPPAGDSGIQRSGHSGTLSSGRIVPPPPVRSGTIRKPNAAESMDDEDQIFDEDDSEPDDEPEQVGIAPGESLASISSGKLAKLEEFAREAPRARQAKPAPRAEEAPRDDAEEEEDEPARVLGLPPAAAYTLLGLLVGGIGVGLYFFWLQ
jgi:serine/threonine protein kinase